MRYFILVLAASCAAEVREPAEVDYSDPSNWVQGAECERDDRGFLVDDCPHPLVPATEVSEGVWQRVQCYNGPDAEFRVEVRGVRILLRPEAVTCVGPQVAPL